MGRVIQMVPVAPGEASVFITGFNVETNEITFRSTRAKERSQTEKITLGENNMVFTQLYNFNRAYIDKFLMENA